MNKSPINYLLSVAIIAILWVVFAILMGSYLSETPNLSDKDPASLANELRMIFGAGALATIFCICYWYYYGDLEKTAGELNKAKRKWNSLFIVLIIVSVALALVIVLMNLKQGIQANWFCIYYGLLAAITFISFWITTLLMSPSTVKYVPIGKR